MARPSCIDEEYLQRAARMLGVGVLPSDVRAVLLRDGCSEEEIYLVVRAAEVHARAMGDLLFADARVAREVPGQRAKFDRLRAKYLATREALGSFRRTIEISHGRWELTWLSRGQRTKYDRLADAVDRAWNQFFTHLQAISPRDWSSGVPTWWLGEKLSYEDAVRPVTEPLSVTPDLAYGATEPIRRTRTTGGACRRKDGRFTRCR